MEVEFNKYKTKGAGYHWDEVSPDPLKRNAFVVARYGVCVDLLRKHCGTLRDKEILDFGCGDGVLAYSLFKEGARTKGIDMSQEAIDFAKTKHAALGSNAEFVQGSCYKTPFADGQFDGLVSSDVIEHVQDTEAFCAEIRRIVKPGGIVVISTPVRVTAMPLDKNHVQEFYPEEFKKLLSRHFEVKDLRLSHPVFWSEFYFYSFWLQRLLNLAFFIYNPFLSRKRWKMYYLQCAVCTVRA